MTFIKIAPSVLDADILNIYPVLKALDACDEIHLDIMDGAFVPNISFGLPVVKLIAEKTAKPLDAHLMIKRPEKYIDSFAKYVSSITFHAEAAASPICLAKHIRDTGCKAAIAFNPLTPVDILENNLEFFDKVLIMSVEPGFGGQKFIESVLKKVKFLRSIDKDIEIQIDGGINDITARLAVGAGCSNLVAGSFIFKEGVQNAAARLNILKEAIK